VVLYIYLSFCIVETGLTGTMDIPMDISFPGSEEQSSLIEQLLPDR